jgi:hypothetical protein
MLLLVFEGIQFSYGVHLLLYGSKTRGRFSLLVVGFATRKFNILLCLLWRIIKFMIISLLGPNLQQFGGVRFGLTKCMPFSSL